MLEWWLKDMMHLWSNHLQQRCHSHIWPPKPLQSFAVIRNGVKRLTHPLPHTSCQHIHTHINTRTHRQTWRGFSKCNNNHIVLCCVWLCWFRLHTTIKHQQIHWEKGAGDTMKLLNVSCVFEGSQSCSLMLLVLVGENLPFFAPTLKKLLKMILERGLSGSTSFSQTCLILNFSVFNPTEGFVKFGGFFGF